MSRIIVTTLGSMRKALNDATVLTPGGTATSTVANRTITITDGAVTYTDPRTTRVLVNVHSPLHIIAAEPGTAFHVDATEMKKAMIFLGGNQHKNRNHSLFIQDKDGRVRLFTQDNSTINTTIVAETTITAIDRPAYPTWLSESRTLHTLTTTHAGELARIWAKTRHSLSNDPRPTTLAHYQVGHIGDELVFAATDDSRASATHLLGDYFVPPVDMAVPKQIMQAAYGLHEDTHVDLHIGHEYSEKEPDTFVLAAHNGAVISTRVRRYNRPVSVALVNSLADGTIPLSGPSAKVWVESSPSTMYAYFADLIAGHTATSHVTVTFTRKAMTVTVANYDDPSTPVAEAVAPVISDERGGLDLELSHNNPVTVEFSDDFVDGNVSATFDSSRLVQMLSMAQRGWNALLTFRGNFKPLSVHEDGGEVRHSLMPIRV